jgi:hypothetical protein
MSESLEELRRALPPDQQEDLAIEQYTTKPVFDAAEESGCARCHSPIALDGDVNDWELLDDGIVCAHCVTPAELQALDEEFMDEMEGLGPGQTREH